MVEGTGSVLLGLDEDGVVKAAGRHIGVRKGNVQDTIFEPWG